MADEVYTISTDITSGKCEAGVLVDEITANTTITTALQDVDPVSVNGDTLTIGFVSAISGAEKTELDTLVGAHPATKLVIGKSTMVLQDEKVVSSSATFEKVWGIRSNPAALAADEGFTLAQTFAQVLGEYKCDVTGGDPKYRIQEDGVDIVASTSLADTGGVWVEFEATLPVGSLSALRHRYTFDARLNGGTSLEFRETSLTLIHLG